MSDGFKMSLIAFDLQFQCLIKEIKSSYYVLASCQQIIEPVKNQQN
jgi:hypothetical protein